MSDRGLLMLASSLRKAGGNSALRALRLRSNQVTNPNPNPKP